MSLLQNIHVLYSCAWFPDHNGMHCHTLPKNGSYNFLRLLYCMHMMLIARDACAACILVLTYFLSKVPGWISSFNTKYWMNITLTRFCSSIASCDHNCSVLSRDGNRCSRLKSSMPFKRDLALQYIPLSKQPFKTQPQIENEDIIWSPQSNLPAMRTNEQRALSLQEVELDG